MRNVRVSCAALAVFSTMVTLTMSGALAAREGYQVLWHGQWVDYVEDGDYAVTDGDIIIGHKNAVRDGGKALTIDASNRLWLRAASGIVEVPYTTEAGSAANISGAVAEINRVLAGVLQWVPRTDQPDYVTFNLTSANSGACASFVGRSGGKQQITGDPECGVSTLVHEMGHAMGLWHVQQDASAGSFVDLRMDKMDPSKRGNNQPIFGTRTVAGYDYASIMHYSRTSFPASGDRVTLETKPPGIDVGGSGTYSAADIDALLRLYGGAPARTTVTSNPPGLSVMVDGVAVTTPATFDWPIGSVHRVWVLDQLQSMGGFQFGFGRWSHDASDAPSRQLTWQVTPGDGSLASPTTAPSSTVLTANFVRLINVTATPEVQTGGTSQVVARNAPWPGTTSLYPQFSRFDLRASPAPAYQHYFTWGAAFASDGAAAVAPQVSLLASGSVAAQTVGALFHNGPTLIVDVAGNGIVDGVTLKVTAPGGAASSAIAPRLARTTAGTWKFEMASPQLLGSSIRHYFDSFEGFDNAATGEVAMPASGARAVTVRAHREVSPFKQVIPSCAGSINLSDNGTWLRTGAALNVTLNTALGGAFTGWSGTLATLGGKPTSVATTVGAAVPEYVAYFNAAAEPLRLESVSPAVIGDDSTATTVTITGTGFTPQTAVTIAGVAQVPSFVDSRTLRVTVNRGFITAQGRQTVYATNAINLGCSVASNSLAMEVLPAGVKVGVALTEYYNAALDYYFLTGRALDKSILDTVAGWARTGNEIRLYAARNEETLPLERHFFARVARSGTRGSHFFTALPSDQLLMTSVNPANGALDAMPYLEGIEGYAVPKSATGTCPAGTIPIYRAFKGPPRYADDGNHRFSVSLAQHQDMVTRLGWADEGVVFCGLQ